MTSYISKTNNNKFTNVRPEGTKIDTIVITYSVREDIHSTNNVLHDHGASVHYTIRQDGFQDQYHLENSMAFYAGKSKWHDSTSLNTKAIGIMLINDAKSPFPDVQIDKLIALIQDIYERHGYEMEVLGLGEVTVLRDINAHTAPGKLFPWAKLAEKGIGLQINLPDNVSQKCVINKGDEGKDGQIKHFQEKLIKHGYGIEQTGEFDIFTDNAVKAFVDRYVPNHEYCWSEATEYAINSLIDFRAIQTEAMTADDDTAHPLAASASMTELTGC